MMGERGPPGRMGCPGKEVSLNNGMYLGKELTRYQRTAIHIYIYMYNYISH